MTEAERRAKVRENWEAGAALMCEGKSAEGHAIAFRSEPGMLMSDTSWLLAEVTDPFERRFLEKLRDHKPDEERETDLFAVVSVAMKTLHAGKFSDDEVIRALEVSADWLKTLNRNGKTFSDVVAEIESADGQIVSLAEFRSKRRSDD